MSITPRMNSQPILDSKGGDIEQLSSPFEDDSKPQVHSTAAESPFKRFINLPAIFNFGLCLQADWETLATTFQFSLLNGGPASIVYGGFIAGFGCVAIAMSLAEMASMYVIFLSFCGRFRTASLFIFSLGIL
jgi:choline transport protein